MSLDIIYISFIFLSSLSGLIFVKKTSHFSYKLLIIFLIITGLNESVCLYIKNNNHGSTYVLYNFYYYFRFTIFGVMFFLLSINKVEKKLILIFLLLSPLLFFLNTFYLYGLLLLHSNYQLLGGIMIIILCLFQFFKLIRNTKQSNPLTTPFFWTSTGLFFYFLCSLPFFGIINLLVKRDVIFVNDYLIIVKSLSIFLYSLIGIDFFVQWRFQKSEY